MPYTETQQNFKADAIILETHWFATICSLTERGGRITKASSGLTIAGLALARVGDVVTYKDGSEATIIDGAGEYAVDDEKSLALVGSRLSNGDRIVQTLQTSWGIDVQDAKNVEGIFDPSHVPSPAPSGYRLAVRGATTARGGVLHKPSGTWEVSVALGKVGVIGDLIHYADGTTAKVVSGLGWADNHHDIPHAFVGSELDNGDTITDSPERNGMASPIVFVVVKSSIVNS